VLVVPKARHAHVDPVHGHVEFLHIVLGLAGHTLELVQVGGLFVLRSHLRVVELLQHVERTELRKLH